MDQHEVLKESIADVLEPTNSLRTSKPIAIQ